MYANATANAVTAHRPTDSHPLLKYIRNRKGTGCPACLRARTESAISRMLTANIPMTTLNENITTRKDNDG